MKHVLLVQLTSSEGLRSPVESFVFTSPGQLQRAIEEFDGIARHDGFKLKYVVGDEALLQTALPDLEAVSSP